MRLGTKAMTFDVKELFLHATAAHEAGQWQQAERDYRTVLRADPGHADALHQLGLLAYQTGHAEIAIDLVSKAITRAPETANYYNTLGSALLEARKPDQAVQAFTKARALDPQSVEAGNNLANALHAAGRLDEALAVYRDLLARAPGDADVTHNYARALRAAGRIEDAIIQFRAAHAIRPSDAIVLSHLGDALCAREAWEEAAAVCAKAADMAPDSPVVLANFGNALMGLRRFGDAIGAYEKALVLAPHIDELHINLGVAFHAAHRWPDAARCFEHAVSLSGDPRARTALARTHVAMGNFEEAISHFRAVLDANPEDHEVRLDLGLALNDLGRAAEGLSEIERGPGLARLAIKQAGPELSPVRRVAVSAASPHFIGAWALDDDKLCESLIDLFESSPQRQRQGRTSRGVNLSIKHATDVVVFPRDLSAHAYAPVAAYLRALETCLSDYAAQWPHLGEILARTDLVPFQIQRYRVGEHFQAPHSERMSFGLSHRVLAWMTYLNDVDDGGETRFHNFGLDIRPQRGKTLIWPAEWTHMHAGQAVRKGVKYIITGWMHFPHPKISR